MEEIKMYKKKTKTELSKVFRIPLRHMETAKELYRIAIENDAEFTEVLFVQAKRGLTK